MHYCNLLPNFVLLAIHNLNSLKTKVHTLLSEKDYKLIGIASHLSAHKISWLFNEELNFKFQQSENLIIEDKKANQSHKFSTYEFEDEGDDLYTLYANRTEQAILLKSIKNIDYVIKYEGLMSENAFDQYLQKIKQLKNILTAFEIDLTQLKPKERELFE